MQKIVITGKTFEHREALKAFGARWNGLDKVWTVIDPSDGTIEAIKMLSGVVVQASQTGERKADLPPSKPIAAVTEGNTIFCGNDRTYFNAFAQKNPLTFAGFQSLADMVEFIENVPLDIKSDGFAYRNSGWGLGGEKRSAWMGTPDMPAALDLARTGWREGVAKAHEAMTILDADTATRRKRLAGIAGGHVSVGRLLAGEPRHMIKRHRQPARKVITLFVETVMSHHIKPENAIIRAASVAATCDLLEIAGYSCEIIGVMTFSRRTRPYGAGCHVTVKLKSAGEALNLNDIVFALGHPSFLRRLGFGIMAINPALMPDWSTKGRIDFAFNRQHEPEPGSFYIDQLLWLDQKKLNGNFIERVRSIFAATVPADFPVTLKD